LLEAPRKVRPRGMAIAAGNRGTEPGLQTVWHLLPLARPAAPACTLGAIRAKLVQSRVQK